MTRRSFSGLLVLAPGGIALGKAASSLMTDESDVRTWNWLLDRCGQKGVVKRRNKIEYLGMTNKGPNDVAVLLDKKGRVVRARFNQANFANDEWAELAGFRHLLDLTCWHNYKKIKQGELAPHCDEDHDLSGSGLIAFRDHPLRVLNIGDSSFNNLGLAALMSLPNFRKVRANHTCITDGGLEVLAGNRNLRFLKVGPKFSMKITEASLESIGKMESLTELEFNETFVTWSSGLKHLLPLRAQLKRVKLEKTWIDDACLEKAREAFPKTTFEHSLADRKQIERMKKAFPKNLETSQPKG